jgi:hypothetical protein
MKGLRVSPLRLRKGAKASVEMTRLGFEMRRFGFEMRRVGFEMGRLRSR